MGDEKKSDTFETWTYAGLVYFDGKGAIVQAFVDPHGRELYYDRLIRRQADAIIGWDYQVAVDRTDGVSASRNPQPLTRTDRFPPEKIAEWRVRDRGANAAKQLKKKAAQVKSEWAAELDPVREAYRNAVGPQRTAILAAVIEFITSR